MRAASATARDGDGDMAHSGFVLGCVAVIIGASAMLVKVVGQDFFPAVDSGMIRLHVRCPVGTRIEESSRILRGVEDTIRRVIPALRWR